MKKYCWGTGGCNRIGKGVKCPFFHSFLCFNFGGELCESTPPALKQLYEKGDQDAFLEKLSEIESAEVITDDLLFNPEAE